MITSLYYYNYYKPHIFKNSETKVVKQVPFKQTVSYNNDKKPVNLSKAYNKNVIDYVNDLSTTINSVKVAGNETFQAFKRINGNTRRSEEELKDDLIIALDDLASSLNATNNFSNDVSQSVDYNRYNDTIKEIFQNNKSVLEDIDLSYVDGNFNFDVLSFESKDLGELKTKVSLSENVINEINLVTKDFMEIPMSKHMEFKSFSYYFNYALGVMDKDSFGVIGSGTILDLQL